MCGIFGAQWINATPSGRELAQRSIILAILAQAMATRGRQSWGFMCLRSDNGQAVHRKGVGPITVQDLSPYAGPKSVCGHTRFATTGEVSVENAHPFRIGKIMGLHNGTLSGHESLNRKYGRNFAVDSMHLVAHIDEKKDLSEIDSYGAMVYADAEEPGILFMGRWSGGSLSVWKTPIGTVWASTESPITEALNLTGLRSDSVPYEIKERTLYAAENGALFIRKGDFFTCERAGASSWESGFVFGTPSGPNTASGGPDGSSAGRFRVGSSGSPSGSRPVIYRGNGLSESEASKIASIARKHGLPRNHMRRILDPTFDPTDPNDIFYATNTGVDASLFNAVAEALKV